MSQGKADVCRPTVRQVQIEQYDIEVFILQRRHGFADQAGMSNVYRIAVFPQGHPQKIRVCGIILDQQYFSRRSHEHTSPPLSGTPKIISKDEENSGCESQFQKV
jgi:hypothetical protein